MEGNDTPRITVTVLGKDYLLSKKQEFFCRYWVANGHNGAKAAEDSGYAKKNAKQSAHENLTKPYLIKFIEELEKPELEKLDIDENWVLSKLKDFADVHILDFFDAKYEKTGDTYTVVLKLKDLNTIPKEKLRCLESLKDKGDGVWEIKLVKQLPVVVNIGRNLGMWKDTIEGSMTHTHKASVYIIPNFEEDDDDNK